MKQPTFFEGISIALAASITATALFTVLISFFSMESVIKLLIALLSLGYISYLLSRSRERLGRATLIGSWLLVTTAIWFLTPSLALYGLTHLGLIWIVRALYHYSSLLSALADLGLNAVALAAATWAASQTDSLFITTWCFFLIQALFVYIPPKLFRKTATPAGIDNYDDRFQQAHHAAEAALHKLSTIN